MNNFGLNTPISGLDPQEFMAKLIEANEKQEIEIERGKLTVGILKQMHNHSRLLVDAAKFELKNKEFLLRYADALAGNVKIDLEEKPNESSSQTA